MSIRLFLILPLCVVLCGCGSTVSDGLSLEEAVEEATDPECGQKACEGAESGSMSGSRSLSDDRIDDNDVDIYVYVCGRVNAPGVYILPAGSRKYEAVLRAGGLAEDADASAVNQAEACCDGEMIYIPAKGENSEGEDIPLSDAADDRININTADSSELQTLKGIGASRAEDIIDYREKNGKFEDAESIMKVPGIKQGTFDRIKDKIRV